MTRQGQIKIAADKYCKDEWTHLGFVAGAEWADEHPDIDVRTMAAWRGGYQAAIDAHPHWISVEDELPPRGRTDPYVSVPVITCKIVNRGLHEIGFQRYIFGNGKWEYCDATHWMPLPEPPKKGGEE